MSLYENINKRKKAGTSRPKSKSTVSKKAYANMKAGFPKSKKKKAETLITNYEIYYRFRSPPRHGTWCRYCWSLRERGIQLVLHRL